MWVSSRDGAGKFQSTLPARGATKSSDCITIGAIDFNPRSPHGERLDNRQGGQMQMISIHAPRTGSDKMADEWKEWAEEFQSTLPARGATPMDFSIAPSVDISIHAPRTGSDLRTQSWGTRNQYFNPRSPHGERQLRSRQRLNPCAISIHAPRTGSDCKVPHPARQNRHFNPRSPHGERLESPARP